MPHVVYLHSALTKSRCHCRDDAERRELLRFTRLDVLIGLSAAGVDQHLHAGSGGLAVLLDRGHAARTRSRRPTPASAPSIGGSAALAFGVALLASGLSSSSVGTYAGQVVMQGFLRRHVPLFLRRAVTMAPALIVLGLGLPATDSLVVSQVVLSFGIPFALIPLALVTRRVDIMGAFVNSPATTRALAAITSVVIVAQRLPGPAAVHLMNSTTGGPE